ncbi:hypothetical protein HK405_006678, partial [Cladochytrium tenue]
MHHQRPPPAPPTWAAVPSSSTAPFAAPSSATSSRATAAASSMATAAATVAQSVPPHARPHAPARASHHLPFAPARRFSDSTSTGAAAASPVRPQRRFVAPQSAGPLASFGQLQQVPDFPTGQRAAGVDAQRAAIGRDYGDHSPTLPHLHSAYHPTYATHNLTPVAHDVEAGSERSDNPAVYRRVTTSAAFATSPTVSSTTSPLSSSRSPPNHHHRHDYNRKTTTATRRSPSPRVANASSSRRQPCQTCGSSAHSPGACPELRRRRHGRDDGRDSSGSWDRDRDRGRGRSRSRSRSRSLSRDRDRPHRDRAGDHDHDRARGGRDRAYHRQGHSAELERSGRASTRSSRPVPPSAAAAAGSRSSWDVRETAPRRRDDDRAGWGSSDNESPRRSQQDRQGWRESGDRDRRRHREGADRGNPARETSPTSTLESQDRRESEIITLEDVRVNSRSPVSVSGTWPRAAAISKPVAPPKGGLRSRVASGSSSQ